MLYLIIVDGSVFGIGTAAEIDALVAEGMVPADHQRQPA